MTRVRTQDDSIQRARDANALTSRQTVHKPTDGVGFAHGSSDVDLRQIAQWLSRQSKGTLSALKDPRTDVIIAGRTSGTGSREINTHLAQRRAEKLAALLSRQPGIRARLVPRGEPGALTGRDNPADRVAILRVEAATPDRVAGPNPIV